MALLNALGLRGDGKGLSFQCSYTSRRSFVVATDNAEGLRTLSRRRVSRSHPIQSPPTSVRFSTRRAKWKVEFHHKERSCASSRERVLMDQKLHVGGTFSRPTNPREGVPSDATPTLFL